MPENNKKLIWDIPVRLFHWLIVVTICYSWYAVEIKEDMDHHFISGYIALGLILFRVLWGFMGSRYARFGNFIYSPGEILAYAKTLFSREGGKYAGHNPLGGLSVLALLLVILVQTVTGLFANDEYYYFAPLSDNVSGKMAGTLTEIHELNFNIILALAILHIVAILFYRFYKKEKLILAMFTGRKVDEHGNYEAIPGSRLVAATVLILAVAAGVYLLANYA